MSLLFFTGSQWPGITTSFDLFILLLCVLLTECQTSFYSCQVKTAYVLTMKNTDAKE